jgi:alcohol dehydrogenase (cytochrome c)
MSRAPRQRAPSRSARGGRRQELAAGAYNPELNRIYIPSSEGCNQIEGVTQTDFEDQGGPVKPRDRFAGGGNKNLQQTTGSIKALDPLTGETKAVAAYDGTTLQEVWRFETGCGVMAPPISYAVNGKQYIAVAIGPHWLGVRPAALKYANACSMVYVFTL